MVKARFRFSHKDNGTLTALNDEAVRMLTTYQKEFEKKYIKRIKNPQTYTFIDSKW